MNHQPVSYIFKEEEELLNYVAVGDIHPNALGEYVDIVIKIVNK